MAGGQHQVDMTMSLLDRLLDFQPESAQEVPVSSWEQLREFKTSLCRGSIPFARSTLHPDSISHRVIRTRGIGDRPEIDRRERTWKFDERRAAVRKSVVRPRSDRRREAHE